MLIFVKKKEYETLKDLCTSLRSERDSLLDTVKEKNKSISTLEKEIMRTISTLEKEKENNEKIQNNLAKSITVLSTSNDKMISWIKTIIHDIGSYKVNERNTIKIPLYKEERIKRNYFDNEFGPVESSIETHIPAIDFIETTQFGCDYSSGLSINDKGDLNG